MVAYLVFQSMIGLALAKTRIHCENSAGLWGKVSNHERLIFFLALRGGVLSEADR